MINLIDSQESMINLIDSWEFIKFNTISSPKGEDYIQRHMETKGNPVMYYLKIKSFGRWCCSAPNVEVRRNVIRFTNDAAFEHIAPAASEVAPASDGGTITMEIRRPARPGRRMVPSRHGTLGDVRFTSLDYPQVGWRCGPGSI
jgi:hypothetical protein